MAFYDDLATTAANLIADKGQAVTFTIKNDGTFDPITGTETGDTESTQSVNVAVLPATKANLDKFDNIFSEGLTYQDRRFLLMAPKKTNGTALDFLPVPGSEVTLESKDWIVAGYTPLSPAGTPVLYRVGVYI